MPSSHSGIALRLSPARSEAFTVEMRIGIDAREICGKPTGVGRHLSGLLRAWSTDTAAAKHTFVLYAHDNVTTPIRGSEVRVVGGSPGTAWEQFLLPKAAKQDDLDVFFAPGYTAPLRWTIPTVVLVHDISFTAHPEWFRWKEGLRRRWLTRWSSEHARLVLTVSESARREIILHFGFPENRVRCIYPGVVALGMQSAPGASVEASSRPWEPTVLFAGSVFNRRHVPDLIRAFRPIARSHAAARLHIVGDNRTHPYEDLPAIAATLGIAPQVSIRPYIFDDDLAGLYRRARAFAFLSEYEGFGHPPLEALGSGVPPVLLETDVAREVCGDAALYVAKHDIASTTAALNSLLFDERVRRHVLDAAPAVLARYSWTRAATATLAALEAAA
jgi:glycosyltransferase involved in cell wall biosynthesis